MLKLIALISAKPDISREAFIKHYETSHAPLVKRLLPMIAEYGIFHAALSVARAKDRFKRPPPDSMCSPNSGSKTKPR